MTTVYRLRDRNGRLLYVGVTGNMNRRMSQHRSKPWWSDVADIETKDYPTRSAARAAESRAIRTENPRWNIQGALPSPNLTGIGRYAMTAEIVSMFGVTRQAVDQWTRKPIFDFPAPAVTLHMGRIWRTEDVVKWADSKSYREVETA